MVSAKRIEMYDLKSKKYQVEFKELTNTGNYSSEVFENDENLDKSTNRFIKRLENIIKQVGPTPESNSILKCILGPNKLLTCLI